MLQARSLGGGLGRFASPDDIVVVRRDARGARRIPFVWSRVVGAGQLEGDVELAPGDTVIVP